MNADLGIEETNNSTYSLNFLHDTEDLSAFTD